jgi:hypothetical protein
MLQIGSRPHRSQAVTFAAGAKARENRNGLRILPDEIAADRPAEHRLAAVGGRPAEELDRVPGSIKIRHGRPTADFAAICNNKQGLPCSSVKVA